MKITVLSVGKVKEKFFRDAIAEYEKAVRLVKVCNERLADAEQRVRLLTEAADGSVSDIPFGGVNED